MHQFLKQCTNVWFVLLTAFAILTVLPSFQPVAFAQSSVTGSINGTVTDSTGAVVPGATVTVKDTTTGAVHTYTTNDHGLFTAPFLPPNVFNVSATAPGLQSTTTSVQILNGQQSQVTVTVTPTASSQTVQVSANNAQLIDTQTSNTTTTFTTRQFQNLPMPGGDITTIALTVPGVTVNVATAGNNVYGAFESDGLSTLSNLVVVNGADDDDPFLSINNSGSSNLTLGQQEIAQASVVQNGYSVQYGRQAGVIENFVTKSGSNRVHGLLQYNYNSSGLNANDFFNNHYGVAKSKAVSNQYAAQIGGPIKHDKLFFFVNTEGLRYILPSSGFVNFPSPSLQASMLANPAVPASAKSTYSTIFSTMKAGPAYATATPIAGGGCGSLAGSPDYSTGGTFGASDPCLSQAFVNAANLNREWLATGRLDWTISARHQIFFRVTDDQGQQPAFTSLINPLWNIGSTQPAYSGQLNDTFSFTPNLVNQLIASSLYYGAIFKPNSVSASLASSPQQLIEGTDGGNSNLTGIGQNTFGLVGLGVPWFIFPQGRNVSQYQIADGLAWLKSTHSFKFGFDLKRDNVTDTVLQENSFGGYYIFGGAADFAGGTLPGSAHSTFTQAFSHLGNIYSALYNVGFYAQDEWKVKPNLTVDYGVRFDRTGNPGCVNNCYSHYVGGFPDTSATLDTPYSTTLSAGHRDAFPSIEKGVFQPRAGFNWDTKGDGKTVLRGGVGLFADSLAGTVLETVYNTFPNEYTASIGSGNVGTGPGTASATATASANAVLTGFSQGASFNSISAALAPSGITFAPPNYGTTPQQYHTARYLEYSMQLQRQLGASDALILSYAGNHGFDETMPNNHSNQYVDPAVAGGSFGLPAASPDPRFAQVTDFSNNAISNYNGFSVQYKHIDRRGLTADVSYTWSHALDDISNGGGGGTTPINTESVNDQITPNSVSKLMYSNSDYDFRNNFSADLTYVEPMHFANKIEEALAAGWTAAGKAYWRSGAPFTVFNSNAETAIFNGTSLTPQGSPGYVLAQVLNNHFNHVCKSFSQPCFQTPGILNGSSFTTPDPNGDPAQTNYGNVPRNSFRGPHYADVDVTLYKNIFQKGATQFQVGAQAYNVLNHPNFGLPSNNASTGTPAQTAGQGSLGVISTDVGPPTGPYGSGLTSAVSGRVLVVQGRFIF
ncbi:MAG: carboxypeptidase regulatory-like domain-containing protein [Acidobacteriaceae bacterium]